MSLPDDPAALFGAEACADLRALKRAYARLLRAHGPEVDPVGFQHVHSRYERVRARLEAAAAAPAGAEAAEVPAARAPEQWARWLQDRPEPPTLAELQAELDAASPADVAAPVLRFALDAGREPACTRARLLALLDRPELVPQAFGVCRMAFALDPGLLDEDWHRLGSEVARRAPGPPFDIARIDALLAAGRPREAWSAWREVGGRLLRQLPEIASGRLYELVKRAAWTWTPAELEAERLAFQEVGLPLSDEVREALDQYVVVVAAVRAAEADPKVPRPIVATVRRVLGAGGGIGDAGVLMLIRDLFGARPGLTDELAALDHVHPVLSTTLLRQLGRISGRYRAVEAGAAPRGEGPPLLIALEELEERSRAAGVTADASPWRRFTPAQIGMHFALLALAAALSLAFPAFLLLLGFTVSWSAQAWRRAVKATPNPLAELPLTEQKRLRTDLLAVATRTGAWTHELAAHAARHGLDALRPQLDALVADPWTDAHVLGLEHLRRACFPPPEAK